MTVTEEDARKFPMIRGEGKKVVTMTFLKMKK